MYGCLLFQLIIHPENPLQQVFRAVKAVVKRIEDAVDAFIFVPRDGSGAAVCFDFVFLHVDCVFDILKQFYVLIVLLLPCSGRSCGSDAANQGFDVRNYLIQIVIGIVNPPERVYVFAFHYMAKEFFS